MIRSAVSAADAAAMSALADEWMDADDASFKAPFSRNPPPEGGSKTHFTNAHYGHELFEQLNTNPKILRVVAGLCAQ